MKKIGSSGNIQTKFNYKKFKRPITFSPITSVHYKYPKRPSSRIIFTNYNQYNSFENDKNNNQPKTSKQLYEDLLSLKKKVNFLNSEISLAKSSRQKKDVQLTQKNKNIEN